MFGYTQEMFLKDRRNVELFELLTGAVVKAEQEGKPVGKRMENHLNKILPTVGMDVKIFPEKDSSVVLLTDKDGTVAFTLPSEWDGSQREVAGINAADSRVQAWKRWNADDAKSDREQVASLDREIAKLEAEILSAQQMRSQIQNKYL